MNEKQARQVLLGEYSKVAPRVKSAIKMAKARGTVMRLAVEPKDGGAMILQIMACTPWRWEFVPSGREDGSGEIVCSEWVWEMDEGVDGTNTQSETGVGR